ncbi:uncharacterized protein STEHIDRAFT_163682 [Stereum hirsutum FP-91666 SS1]|uniref:DUF6532 domain-containing protein n=1 Tax=Stereum hirsutum (strain FP-91666) TaxID=721885 RepID=R7RXA3_STEHR|nr:uncharacterized protein STEHIDRAFT_163682 [Stereum hirsutum FP-91666 SS1]EIM79495.1 hypothetical protein STEHIDRAFT_163682 [Stereum hirsutum FP-91666 SS1]
MAGSSIKVSKNTVVSVVPEAPTSMRASKASASKAWEALAKKTKKTLSATGTGHATIISVLTGLGTRGMPCTGIKTTGKSSIKAGPTSKRKPQSDAEAVPVKKAKHSSLLSGKVSLSSSKRGRRTVPNLDGSDSEGSLPSRISARIPLADKGKAKAPPAEDESSGGSSEEFQPSDSSEGDTDDEDHEQDDDDEGGDVGLNDAAARLNRKQTRKAAKEKAIKKAIIAGTFDARWPEDKENIPPAELAVRAHRLSTSSMPSLETLTDDEDDGPLVAAAAPPPPPPPPPPPSIPIGSTKFPARNIELVHPAPGRRFLSLRAQPQPVQDVFEPALENLACEIYGVDAFPDRRTRADMKVGALLAALRGMSHHDIETRIWNDPVYTRLFGSLLEPRIPLMRSSVHDIADSVVLDEFDLPNKAADRAREVLRLTAACTLLYPLGSNGKPDRARPFYHPSILSTFHKKFLSGSPNFLEIHSRELGIARSEDDAAPVRVPGPMIAFVAVAVYASLIEWRSGHHVPIEFSRDNFNHTYRQYCKRFEDLRERFGVDVYRQYLSEFYETAMAFGSDDDISIGADDDWDAALIASRFAADEPGPSA